MHQQSKRVQGDVLPYRPTTGLLRPPLPNGQIATRNAELTIYALGEDEDEIIPCLRMLGEFNRRELRRFQGSLPVTLTLPASYYDRSNAFVSLLKTTGTQFLIRSWTWACPDELKDDHHWCKGACMVQEIEERVTS